MSTRQLVVCADVGSTYTKVMAVDVTRGELLAAADHPTTMPFPPPVATDVVDDPDVLDGLDRAVADLARRLPGEDLSLVRACSSAGGGLRLAVVGHEALVTAEAGHRVGLSAGARVVHVAAGRLDSDGVAALRRARPDIVLLVGGTDGGDDEVLRHNAAWLHRIAAPIVLAGNWEARDELTAELRRAGRRVLPTDNVLPRIGELHPRPARAAIREVFLRHVIGGKQLSRSDRFADLVRGATPDVMLTAVELLAECLPPGQSDVVVIDVGGATTDVYSVLTPDPEAQGPRREVAGTLWQGRTVEGDLGLRWSATGVVEAATAEGLLAPGEAPTLHRAAQRRTADPALLPTGEAERDIDRRLTGLAVTVALRRHARGERAGSATAPRRGGKDLRQVSLVVGSGGVLRHAATPAATTVLRTAVGDHAGGWPLPAHPRYSVDRRYVLAAAGLLAADHRDAARRLLSREFRLDTPGTTRRHDGPDSH